MDRRPYPTGPAPTADDNNTIIYRTADMTFTLGDLRHAGATDEEIAADLRNHQGRLHKAAARWLLTRVAPPDPSPPLDPADRYGWWLATGRDPGRNWKEIMRDAAL